MNVDVPIRYTVSIGLLDDSYWAIIYLPETNEYARCSNSNLTKLMNLVSCRIRNKEKELKNAVAKNGDSPQIVLPPERGIIIAGGE